jgi:hypothetical protein
MSEQNILNPVLGTPMSPDYGDPEQLPEMISRFTATDGSETSRRTMARGRVIDMTWNKRLQSTCDALRQWQHQYEKGFFTYVDWERSRYYTGRFAGPLQFINAGFNQWNIRGQFIELPGLPMYQYPTNWNRDAIFLQERDDFGNDLVKLTGTWGYALSIVPLGGAEYFSSAPGDTAEWQYFGYGFSVWAPKTSDGGRADVYLDGVWTGSNIDFYAAAITNSASLFTKADVPLGLHRVKLVVLNSHSVGSTGFKVYADAIQVMR